MKKGRVDATAEISKLEKKQVLAEQNKAKLLKTTQQPGYEKTAKDEVRQQNQERVCLPRVFFSCLAGLTKIDGQV
jgi:valyl-tRNA synthetase